MMKKIYVLLITGLVIIVISAVGWLVVPEWRNAPGGFLSLIGVVVVGVFTVIPGFLAMLRDLDTIEKKEKISRSQKKNRGNITKDPLRIFLSYAKDDKTQVQEFYQRLITEGYKVWFDEMSLLPGQVREVEIRLAAHNTDVFIVCLSRNSVKKDGYIHDEIRFALDEAEKKPLGEIYIIPMRLDECEIPHELKSWHSINYFEDGSYDRLKLALQHQNNKLDKQIHLPFSLKWLLFGIICLFLIILLWSGPIISNYKSMEQSQINSLTDQPSITIPATQITDDSFFTQLIRFFVTPSPQIKSTLTLHDTQKISDTKTPSIIPGTTQLSLKDNMISLYIPAGEFMMGALDNDKNAQAGETPQHKVYLGEYWMDKTEVTNAMYERCVEENACTPPRKKGSHTRSSYYGNPYYAAHPVIDVDWHQASAYCEWVGGRLPSEAEWEKAARGTEHNMYPWGIGIDCEVANFKGKEFGVVACVGDTKSTGSYIRGASPYGVLDLVGNVAEWVQDWYDGQYYLKSPHANPLGPSGGDQRVIRGGGWGNSAREVQVTHRMHREPGGLSDTTGFRCVRPR